MQLSVGTVVEGKVSKITNFGAFINIDGGGSGMVHISEVANTYVKDINEHLNCLLYTSPSPRDRQKSRMPSSA